LAYGLAKAMFKSMVNLLTLRRYISTSNLISNFICLAYAENYFQKKTMFVAIKTKLER
jgi:hypothetical protein